MSDHALVIGEALVDVVSHPDGTTESHPGGSPANVALGLARLGRDAELLASFGSDHNGALVREHLEASGVVLAHGAQAAPRTSVALARLDDAGVAQYEFDLTWDISPDASPRANPLVLHTGSIAAVLEPGASKVVARIQDARASATITYDPNARPALMGEPADARVAIERVVALSDVVKVSDEDLEWLAPEASVDDVARGWSQSGPALVVVTRGGDGATAFMADGRRIDVTAPKVKVVDTVGAGDSFMGGLIDGLWEQKLLGAENRRGLLEIADAQLRRILERCALIAAVTVSRAGANPPGSDELLAGGLPA